MKKVKKMENGPSFDNSFVDKTLPTTSISTILSMLQEPFDQKGVAEKTFNKRFNDPTSEYYQMTVEEIIEKWEDKAATSRRYGKMNENLDKENAQLRIDQSSLVARIDAQKQQLDELQRHTQIQTEYAKMEAKRALDQAYEGYSQEIELQHSVSIDDEFLKHLYFFSQNILSMKS